MNQTIVILNSYIYNSSVIKGNFPIYVAGISQCCVDENGVLTVTPVIVPQN